MSRIGKKPIPLPAGVTASVKGTEVTVKGPKGTLSRTASVSPSRNLMRLPERSPQACMLVWPPQAKMTLSPSPMKPFMTSVPRLLP